MDLNNAAMTMPAATGTITFEFGSFEGFNFRQQSAILNLTARQVVEWNHDEAGEAEFWPAGDHTGVALVFWNQDAVTASELLELDRVLHDLGGDSIESFLRVYYMMRICGTPLAGLSAAGIDEVNVHFFLETNFTDLRREAAYELFELYYPEEYRVWEKSCCDGLIFDTDRFLDSPCFFTDEVSIGDRVALIVAPQ